jgi:hypothetical protein
LRTLVTKIKPSCCAVDVSFSFDDQTGRVRTGRGSVPPVVTERSDSLLLYLGHKNIRHTVRYTELAPGRFKDFGGLKKFVLARVAEPLPGPFISAHVI